MEVNWCTTAPRPTAWGIIRRVTAIAKVLTWRPCAVQVCLALAVALPAAADNTTKINNDLVKIELASDMPHHLNARHRHEENRVMVYLDGGDMTLVFDDGHKDEQHWKPGDVAWSPGQDYHTSEDVGSTPMHIVEVVLKKPGPATQPVRSPKLDPVAIDPTHNILLFENDQVRVIRSWREPGGSEALHEHVGRGRVAIFLTDIDERIKNVDGTTSELRGVAGDARWTDGPATHSTTNLGSKKSEVIIVEVK